jgi:hypothetical protein
MQVAKAFFPPGLLGSVRFSGWQTPQDRDRQVRRIAFPMTGKNGMKKFQCLEMSGDTE